MVKMMEERILRSLTPKVCEQEPLIRLQHKSQTLKPKHLMMLPNVYTNFR